MVWKLDRPGTRGRWEAWRFLLVTVTALALVLGVSPVLAASEVPPPSRDTATVDRQLAQAQPVAFDIPARPLASALTMFGDQAALQVTADSVLVADHRSQPVFGRMTPEDALSRLLAGTGLSWRFADATTLVLVDAAAAKEAGPVRLAPITVKGELIDRSLADTGTSAEVLYDDAIEERAGLDSVKDVVGQTSNVSSLPGSIYAPTIRGVDGTGPAIGGNAFLAGTRPRLTTQIDGRPSNYNQVIYDDLGAWDLERVEVLRGPQSTLVGRNSIAGTVIVETRDPIFDTEAAAQVAGGNLDQRRVSGMVNAPIVDGLVATRVAVDWNASESHVNFVPYPGVKDPDDKEATNARGKVLLLPRIGVDSELLLTLTHHRSRVPGSERVEEPFDADISSFPQQPVHTLVTNSIGAEFTTSLSETFTLEVGSSFTDFSFDRDATAQGGPAEIESTEYVVEPKLLFRNAAGYSAVAGVYFHQIRSDEFLNFVVDNYFEDDTGTIAAYAEGIIPLSDRVDLLLGARYEREDRKRTGGDDGSFIDLELDETYDAFLPKIGLNWHPTETMSWGVQVSRGFNAGGAGVTFPFPALFPIIAYSFDSEYVWNYEIYGRQEFAGGRVRTTQNLFFADYTDMQLSFDETPTNTLDGAFSVENFDKVRTYGAEFGVEALISDSLSLYGSVGLLHTEIVDAPNADLEGNELQTAPNLTANVGVVWRHGDLRASASARYSGAYYSDIENRSGSEVDPFLEANAEVAYSVGGLEIFGSARNTFDSNEPIFLVPSSSAAFPDRAILQRPRTFLVGLKARF